MANKISINELSKAIEKEVRNWTKETIDDVNTIKKEVAKEGVQALKAKSPQRTGDYAKNWTSKTLKNDDQIIYQKSPTASLTHLLEKGHAKRDGGRVAAQVHIAPIEEDLVANFTRKLEKRLSQ